MLLLRGQVNLGKKIGITSLKSFRKFSEGIHCGIYVFSRYRILHLCVIYNYHQKVNLFNLVTLVGNLFGKLNFDKMRVIQNTTSVFPCYYDLDKCV